MADEITTPGVSTEGPTAQDQTQTQVGDTPQTISKEEHEKAIAYYQNQISQIKKSQAGADKIVTELKTQLEELKKSKMSDQERAEYEKQLFEQEKLNFEREKKELEIKGLRSDFIAENKLDIRIKDFLSATDAEGLKEQVDTFNSIVADAVKPVQEELDKLKAEMGRPGGGAGDARLENPFETDNIEMQNKLFLENRPLYDKLLKEYRGKQ